MAALQFQNLTKFVLAAALVISPVSLTHAGHHSDDVQVSVTYDINMPQPEGDVQLEAAMQRSRELVYSRIKMECVEMKRHIAQTCELTRLDIKQGTKRGHRKGKAGMMNTRASARYRITLMPNEK